MSYPQLEKYFSDRYPQFLRGIQEARAVSPQRFDEISTLFLGWLVKARGPEGIQAAADAFVRFTTDVNLSQARYEEEGAYKNKSFKQVYDDHYSHKETMSDYLWGVYLTNFLWAHHMKICLFYQDHFLKMLPRKGNLVEIAPGHGGWGAWALSLIPEMHLKGFDISASSIEIATKVTRAAGLDKRASYVEKNALELDALEAGSADGIICSFLVEHLEQPEKLFSVFNHLLKPRGIGYVTGALTAAQVDHIFEFKRESELVTLCERNGLRVLSTLSVGPERTFPKAKFLPRSMALIFQKRSNDIF